MRRRSDVEFVAAFALGAALGAGVALLLGRDKMGTQRPPLRTSPGMQERRLSSQAAVEESTTVPARRVSPLHDALEAARSEVGEFVQVVAHELAHSVLRRLHGSKESPRPRARSHS